MKSFFDLKKALLNFCMVFTTVSLIFCYLYLRISKKEVYIVLIAEEINKHHLMFLYFFFTSCFILFLLLINTYVKMRQLKIGTREIGVFGKLVLHMAKTFSPLTFFYKTYSLVFHWVSPRYMKHVVTYANNILDYSNFKNKCIIISAVILPRAVIVCILIFEIYLKTLHYYFFSLFLLFIPLVFRFLLFIYSDISTQMLPKLNELVEQVPQDKKITVTLNGKTESFGVLVFRFKRLEGDDPKVTYDLDYFMFNFYNPMLFIGPHMEVKILPLYHKYTSITLLLYYSIQIICWGYIIFFI